MQHTFFKELLDQILHQGLKGRLPKILLMMKINGDFSSYIITLNKQSSCNKYHFNSLIKLRGGGCVTSVQERSIDKVIQNEQRNLEISLPDNFLEDLNNSLKLIVEQSKFIGDNNQRNAVLIKIQWFIYNREYLNSFCIDKKETSKIYELIQENFQSLLTVLTTYLRSSGFICYQVLQTCNELLRILFAFQLSNPKRFFEETVKQDYLQHIAEFNTQLEIEQANVWKTGIEFEITMMKIMIMNSKSNSTQGSDLLLNFFQETAKSIISLSPSENLLQSIIDGGQYLLKKGIEKKLYPKETYQTYYLFQLIKWSIIRQLKSKQSVYKQIQFLKDIFQQYISDSNNWILHFM
ncbi:unnamed protein product [Paramecium sonneborni]|uniref:Uncharacterized protein n=1 Tax=Paramecium sonneborni TaxID=65129 RepID=A0A8S1RK67_9CILI|nr:unnamed protein product [Paramecium sonneborni]